MSKQYYDENGNPVEVENTKKRGGCLKWVGIIFGVIILFGACGALLGDDTTDTTEPATEQAEVNEAETEETAEEQPEEEQQVEEDTSEDIELLAIGETATMGDFSVTINNAYFTEERNEFAEETPEQVIAIEYTLENNSSEDYPFGMDMQLYVDGTQADSYPLGTDFGSVSAGRSVDSVAYYGVNGDNIELEWQPMFDFGSDKAIWNIEVQ